MRFTGGSLADGQLGNSPTTIYEVPANTVAVIKWASFFNVSAVTQSVDVYVTRVGSARRQIGKDPMLTQGNAYYLLDGGETLVLSAGDILEAQADALFSIDYLIAGATEDAS